MGRCGAYVELDDGGPLALGGLELGGTQDLDAGRLGPAEARHVLVCTVRVRVRDRVEADAQPALLQLKPPQSQLPFAVRACPCTAAAAANTGVVLRLTTSGSMPSKLQRLRCASHTRAGRQRTEGVDGVGQRDLTVLLVGVVRAGTRVVPEPDAKVLDLLGGLLEDLRKGACGVRHERAAWRACCFGLTWLTDTI